MGPTHSWNAFFFVFFFESNPKELQPSSNGSNSQTNEKLSPKLNSNDAQRCPNGPPEATNGAQGRPRGAPMEPRR